MRSEPGQPFLRRRKVPACTRCSQRCRRMTYDVHKKREDMSVKHLLGHEQQLVRNAVHGEPMRLTGGANP